MSVPIKFFFLFYISAIFLANKFAYCEEDPRSEDNEFSDQSSEGYFKNLLSPKWPIWEKGGSIVLPIISNPDNIYKKEEKRSSEDEPGSIFSQASSALSNLAGAGLVGINSYVQNLTEGYQAQGQNAAKVVGNTFDTIREVAFPHENTSLADGFSNVVKEVQETNKQLGGTEHVQRIASEFADKAKKLVGIGVEGSVSTEKSASTIFGAFKEMKILSSEEPPPSQESTWIIVIAAISVVSIVIISVLVYVLFQRKKNLKKTQFELQTMELGKDEHLKEQLNTLLKQDV